MIERESIYRTNFSLIVAFMLLISAVLIAALIIAYGLTARNVQSEFYSKNFEIFKQTIRPYNDFIDKKVPRITAYQGFLNRSSASEYAASVFNQYQFVKKIEFYHFNISNHRQLHTVKTGGLNISVKNVLYFTPNEKDTNKVNIIKPAQADKSDEDFKAMALKLIRFVQEADTSREPTEDEKFKTFYDIRPNNISYINIPRTEELKVYKNLLNSLAPSALYPQDMITFYLDPSNIPIKNIHTELYEHISIKQVIYDPLDVPEGEYDTEAAFPGAFSDYKLYFQSSGAFIHTEVKHRFLPLAGVVVLIYLFAVLIGWLIYRNLNFNHKLFKLQYDFINNFTHEFKTPVSVIKIAGSNLRSDSQLTDRQRIHYGKILDEEADKLNDLMNKLLSFTQLENKSINIKKEEIKLDDFVQKYIDTFKIKYPDFNLTYVIKNAAYFQSDTVLLGSIFQNMIENAYKYSPPQRKEMQIIIEGIKKEIVFLFKDRGIGVPKNEIDNIFKKFYRIESQYNQNGSVGLGLAFCKELVNFMHGEITVKSKVNEGSEFRIVLPY